MGEIHQRQRQPDVNRKFLDFEQVDTWLVHVEKFLHLALDSSRNHDSAHKPSRAEKHFPCGLSASAARFNGNLDQTGTIAKGKIADLVLLNVNPLENVDNIFEREGVMLHGRWFPQDQLLREVGRSG